MVLPDGNEIEAELHLPDASRDVLADPRERGHGAAVETVEGLFAEALGLKRAREGVPG